MKLFRFSAGSAKSFFVVANTITEAARFARTKRLITADGALIRDVTEEYLRRPGSESLRRLLRGFTVGMAVTQLVIPEPGRESEEWTLHNTETL